jgi:hypothetical protein
LAKGKGKGANGYNRANGNNGAETAGIETTGTAGTGRRRGCAGDVVHLRMNPTNDTVLSVFEAGSILPCSIPPITPGPLPTPTPPPVSAATAFISCLVANGFNIVDIVALTPTDVLFTLVRC